MKASAPATRRFAVRNLTDGTRVADNVVLADAPGARRRGLLGRRAFQLEEGLWIFPTQAIHTFWMRFPIDVAFLDRRLRVRRVYHRLPPFRMTRLVWGARSALELAPGVLAQSGTDVGDELQFFPREDPSPMDEKAWKDV